MSKRAKAMAAAVAVSVVVSSRIADADALANEGALFEPTARAVSGLAVERGRVERADHDGVSWLRVRPAGTEPAVVTLAPAGGEWDLSTAEGIRVTLHNPGDAPVTVRFAALSPDARKLMNACRTATEVLPGETDDFLMRLTRTPEDPTYDAFKPFYMYYKALNVRDNTIDPARVVKLTVAVTASDAKAMVDISAVRASGTIKPAAVAFLPFIDQYGQYTHGDWPGKIYSDADFAGRRAAEAREQAGWPRPPDWDDYGGWAKGPQLKKTGYFYAAKHEGKWWLVDPVGRLFWSYGPTGVGFGGDVTPVTDRENWFAGLPAQTDPTFGAFYKDGRGATYKYYTDKSWRGYEVQRANLLRKYGPDYEKIVARVSHDRLHSWGFNTIGNWSAPEVYGLHQTPYTVPVNYGSVVIHAQNGKDMPDVYDPGWEPAVRDAMKKQTATAGDPWNLGYFIDNERWFGWRVRGAAIGEETLKYPQTLRAKIEFVNQLKAKYSSIEALNAAWGTKHVSWDAMLGARDAPDMKNPKILQDCGDFGMGFAKRYFSVCRSAVKDVAPNNMYLGSRFFGHTDPAIVRLASQFCDVISYNIYDNPPDGRVGQYAKIDAPIMSTEWGIESDPMQTPFRDEKLTALTAAERAAGMTKYVEHALRLPNLVGAHFFQYRDQPLSGRPDGEATLRGFVNVADTPNFELVQANRQVAYRMYQIRSDAK